MTPSTEAALIFAASVPCVYLILIAFGRTLKRRVGVPLGFTYHLFCIAIGIYLPLRLLGLDFAWEPFRASRELGAAVAVLGAAMLIPLLHRFVWEGYFSKRRNQEVPKFLRQTMGLVLVAIAVLIVLRSIYHLNITGVVFTSTVAVGIIGFAMQDLLGSVLAGLAIETGRPFRAGDWLFVEGKYAEVIEVNWRSTRLRTNDHIYLDIPNNLIVKNTIVNMCYPTRLHAMRLRVGVDYAAAPNQVKAILQHAAISAVGVVTPPPPKVFMAEFGDSSVTYEVKFWMEDHALYNDCLDSIRTHIWYGLNRANIKIPYPIRTLQIDRSKPKPQQEIAPAVRETVCRQPFFKCLDEKETEQLLGAALFERFGSGEHLIEQGEAGESMFILLDGSAEVLVQREGKEVRVAELGKGDHFGEMSLLTGEQRSATVRAATDCEVLEIGKPALGAVLQKNDKLLRNLSELLAQRRMETEGVLAATAEYPTVMKKKREYAATFLARLYSFFEL